LRHFDAPERTEEKKVAGLRSPVGPKAFVSRKWQLINISCFEHCFSLTSPATVAATAASALFKQPSTRTLFSKGKKHAGPWQFSDTAK
jgi:hypothetical protein